MQAPGKLSWCLSRVDVANRDKCKTNLANPVYIDRFHSKNIGWLQNSYPRTGVLARTIWYLDNNFTRSSRIVDQPLMVPDVSISTLLVIVTEVNLKIQIWNLRYFASDGQYVLFAK